MTFRNARCNLVFPSALMAETKKIRRVFFLVFLAVILVSISAISFYIGPQEIVSQIGVRNAYIVALLVSFFAGFSAFTAVSFYSMLLTFISGGMNPVVLAFIAGISLSMGDMILFYFGLKGRDLISGRIDQAIDRVANYFHKQQRVRYIPLFSYIYISIIPLPNDWLLLFLASIRFPQKKMFLVIILGDISHAFLITFLAVKGITIFVN